MIIHTAEIAKRAGLKSSDKAKTISEEAFNSKSKILFSLSKQPQTTVELSRVLKVKPRTIRQALLNLEKDVLVKRTFGKSVNKNFRFSDTWTTTKQHTLQNLSDKVCIFYTTKHVNKGYRNHHLILPKNLLLNKNTFAALGFYIAEGSKSKDRSIEVVNSEPKLINNFKEFIAHLGINANWNSRVIFNQKLIRKYSKAELEAHAKEFWFRNCNVVVNKFQYLGNLCGKSRGEVKQGSLNIIINSAILKRFLVALIKCVRPILKINSLLGAYYLSGYLCGEAYVGKRDREIQFACTDVSELNFAKCLLENLGIRCSISKATSTSPPRVLITNLESFKILNKLNVFEFHPEKKNALITKILNYKNLPEADRQNLLKQLI